MSLSANNIRQLLSITRIKADEIRKMIHKKQNETGDERSLVKEPEINNNKNAVEQLKEMLRSLEDKIESLKKQSNSQIENITRADLHQEFN